jgi:hypothetical protein
MSLSADIVDRIVAGVLEQLGRPAEAAAPSADSRGNRSTRPSPKAVLEIGDAVITAGLLEARAINGAPVVFGARSVLTPSAREYLAKGKIDWTRGKDGERAIAAVGSWLALLARSTPALLATFEGALHQSYQKAIVGCSREAAVRAVGALCRGECDGVVVFTDKPEAVACRANRNPMVRAAVVETTLRIKPLRERMGVNLFAVDPEKRSTFDLRNLLREIAATGKPAPPSDWNE